MEKPKQSSNRHVLHFTDLSPLDFERLCLWLLSEEGYTDIEHTGATGSDQGCDIIAKKNGKRWICQCKRVVRFGPEAAQKEISKIHNLLKHEHPDTLLFIITCNISKKTRKTIREKAGTMNCLIWSLTELDERIKRHKNILAEFFDPLGLDSIPFFNEYGFAVLDYLGVIDEMVKREQVLEFSVPLAGEIETEGKFKEVDVWDCIINWLSDEKCSHFAVLGDYGTGKSWLSLRLAKKLADTFREESFIGAMPLLLNFKSYKSGMELDDLISISMDRDYGLSNLNIYRVKELIYTQKIILLLDGLDEMAREIGQRDALVQFSRLGLPSSARVMLTCRTHYFLSGTEQREVLCPKSAILLKDVPRFRILHIKLLDKIRIGDAILRRVEINAGKHLSKFIGTTYNLPELCSRPVLLDLVCRSFEGIKMIERDISSADLYEAYLNAWLGRELQSGKLNIGPDSVILFLENLAEDLLLQNSLWLSEADFMERVSSFAAKLNLNEEDKRSLARRLATSALLRRSSSNGWEFVHRSFQEYLYAKRFFRWECETNGEGYFPVTHVPTWQFISQIVLQEWNEKKAQKWIIERVQRDHDPGLCKTTLRAAAAIWLIKTNNCPTCEYTLKRIMLDWVDLRNVNLSRMNLVGSDFTGSDMRGANLHGAVLRDSMLFSVDFSGADLTGADLRDTDCRLAIFERAITSGVLWEGAKF